jgi:transposase InsO family protein
MAFSGTTVMDERLCFVAACLRGEETMTSICLRFGISRDTGYKWLGRYRQAGALGLVDRSRAPRTVPHRVDDVTAARIMALRQAHPTWGPRKLLARLALDDPQQRWPAASTVGDLLKRHGMVVPRKRRRSSGVAGPAVAEPTASNQSWSADFKGWFRTGDGVRCEPLTISDNYSRYLLTCEAVPQFTLRCVKPLFERAFREHGLPDAIRTDNGAPFAFRRGLGGLTGLSVWFLELDIWPDRITPGRPDQNGRHERMHRTLKEDTASPPAASLAAQQDRFDAWRHDYNTRRPHEALGQTPPARRYQPSQKTYPEAVSPWHYPPDHHTRKIDSKGYLVWRNQKIYLTEALAFRHVALARRDDDDWTIRFRQFDLARIDDRTNTIVPTGLSRSTKT